MPELILRGRRVAYLEQGLGVPLVLLHAGGSSGKQWVKTASLLEDRFRVIVPDLWGFGRTEGWTGERSLTHDHQALLVARVIEKVVSGPAHLVGHSYGGATALRLGLQSKDLVKTLILIEHPGGKNLKRARALHSKLRSQPEAKHIRCNREHGHHDGAEQDKNVLDRAGG